MAELSETELERLAADLAAALRDKGWLLATAESCTGGWAAQAVTAVAGSSAWFERGFVTYSNQAKMDMLGVTGATLKRHGAVSEETVREMAVGALAHSRAQAALAISGVAGPGGGSESKPVGTVCFAWATAGGMVRAATCRFDGDRRSVRMQAVAYAFREMGAVLVAMP